MSGYFEGLIGTRLGSFVVQRMIARGGMGVVYEGYQESLDRSVAIKILYPHLSDDQGFRDRFQREARALAQLNHPNIVRVIDFGVSEQFVYMIMELVRGHSLRDELVALREQNQTLSIVRSMEILQAVGFALTYAHERGFVHRDVKPGNILIDENGHVFLTDFGLVKLEDVVGVTATGAVMGTPEYMAPEQFLATSTAGPAADQYALAVVAYEMLVGRVPFQAPTPVGLLQKHLEEDPPSIHTIDSRLPLTVEPVIRRGLAKDPNARYPTVNTFVRDLDASTTTMKVPIVASAPTLVDPIPARPAMAPPPPMTPVADVTPVSFAGQAASNSTASQVIPPAASAYVAATPPATVDTFPPAVATPTAQSGRPGRLKWLLVAVIPLLAIGVAGVMLLGGGNDDDPKPTATTLAVVDVTATTGSADAPTATTGALVESTATLSSPATPTTAPTESSSIRPTVVVTRPIQNAPTPTSALITIPLPSDDGDEYTTVVESEFVEGEDLSIWTTSSDNPDFTFGIFDGNYVVDILNVAPDGYAVYSYPAPAQDLGDAAMAVHVRIEGDGMAGIMMRRTTNADGTSSWYVCQITNTQEFLCGKRIGDEWIEMVTYQYNAVIIPNDFNTIAVGVFGNEFALQINGTDVASWTDDSLTSGAWGIWVERGPNTGAVKAYFDAVLIIQ